MLCEFDHICIVSTWESVWRRKERGPLHRHSKCSGELRVGLHHLNFVNFNFSRVLFPQEVVELDQQRWKIQEWHKTQFIFREMLEHNQPRVWWRLPLLMLLSE